MPTKNFPARPGRDQLATLPKREQRGSRARCILLTSGSDEDVADRLSALAAPFATIDSKHDRLDAARLC